MIASDTRDANKDIMQAFLVGITQAGITHIINAGQPVPNDPRYPYGICSTTMAYAIHYQQHDCCVIFSASHNPAQYIGLKIVDRDNLFLDTKVLHEIFSAAEKKHIGHIYTTPDTHNTSIYKAISLKSIKKFMDTMTTKFAQVQKRYSFTVDFGHGAGVTYERDFLTHLREK
jgi:phosphomannomutase